MLPMDIVRDTAEVCGSWLVPELQRWKICEEEEKAKWKKIPKHLKSQMSKQYRKLVVTDWASEVPDERQHQLAKL